MWQLFFLLHCPVACPHLLHLERYGRRVCGSDGPRNLRTDAKRLPAAAAGQQYEHGVGVAVHHARPPLGVRLDLECTGTTGAGQAHGSGVTQRGSLAGI